MTEAEWLVGENLFRMPDALGDQRERKLRLAGCAVCRRLWHLLSQSTSRHAVDVAERHADGTADAQQLTSARRGAARAANWSEENEGESLYHAAMSVKFLLGPTSRSPDGPMDGLMWALDAAAHAVDVELLSDQKDVGGALALRLREPVPLRDVLPFVAHSHGGRARVPDVRVP
ncbi:hypothetical protein J8F10_15920 [Gemmata sp. G18]|uniref:Uncharacterized protein n=1 Tax=Gemmata palustris TaxID=2822762 RepID=A0ABS5BSW9_9BACT|nr:hypothetical protein [Gemmata palustris]MBP3956760.1 hypothetical protein [Gemmata palustris]